MSEVIDVRHVTKFSGVNFQAWKFQMRAIFIANDILDIVEKTEGKPEDAAQKKKWEKRDAKAMFIISSSLEPDQLEYLLTCNSSAEMWSKLSTLHEQRSASNKLLLLTRFHEYRMNTSDSVPQHIAKVENMARQLKDLGENVSNDMIMAKLIGSLPSQYNAFVTAWDSVDAEKQTLEILTTRLIKEESRLTSVDDVASALVAVNIQNPNKKSIINKKPKKFFNKKQEIECFYCHKRGHMIKDCRKRLFSENKNQASNNQNKSSNSKDMCAFSSEILLQTVDNSEKWFLDGAASKHMTFQRHLFDEFEECRNEYVLFGDGTTCEVEGHGIIYIKRLVSGEWFNGKLQDVLFVPKLKNNLVSVGANVQF